MCRTTLVHFLLFLLLNLFRIPSCLAIGSAFDSSEFLTHRRLAEGSVVTNDSDEVTINKTCVQHYITPLGSSCGNVDVEDAEQNSSRLRVVLSSMLHGCVQLGMDTRVRRLRVLAGSARLYPVLQRLGSDFSSASGIPLYFNFSTRVGSTSVSTRVAIAKPPPIIDTDDTSGGVDAFILSPTFMPTMEQAGKLLDLSELVGDDMQLKWFQIKKFLREQMVVYGNKIVAIPITTSPVFLYYHVPTFQRDGLKVPNTWESVIALAETYNGEDLNGDKQPDFGICMTPPNCLIDGYLTQWIFSSFVQTHGFQQGAFLDPLTMTNLINSTATIEALAVLRRLRLAGPRFGNCSAFEDQMYLQGRCLMSISSTTTFKAAYLPNAPPTYVAMRGNMGIAPFPGSTRVLDRTTGRMVPCDATLCPLATSTAPDLEGVIRPVNRPSPSNNVVVTINAQSTAKYQFYAYSLFSYLSSPEVLGSTGAALLLDPSLETSPLRVVDLQPEAKQLWVRAGYNPLDVEQFFTACQDAMDNPNQSYEGKFPGAINVTSGFTAAAMMYTNASQPNPPPIALAAAAAAKVMSAVVAEQGGSAAFVTVYRQTLNWVPPPPPPAPPAPQIYGSSSGGVNGAPQHNRSNVLVVAIGVTVPCGVAILLFAVVLAMWSRHRRLGRRASVAAAPGAGPDTTLLVTDIQSSTSLWEHLDAEVMNSALSLHHGIMRRSITDWNGYESATEGDSFIIAFHNPTDALFCALAAQQALLEAPWPMGLLQYAPMPGLEGEDDPLLPVAVLTQGKHVQATGQSSPRPGGVSPYGRTSASNLLSLSRRVVAGVPFNTVSHKKWTPTSSLRKLVVLEAEPSADGVSPNSLSRKTVDSSYFQTAAAAAARPLKYDLINPSAGAALSGIGLSAAPGGAVTCVEEVYRDGCSRSVDVGFAPVPLTSVLTTQYQGPGRAHALGPYERSSTCSELPLDDVEEEAEEEEAYATDGEGSVLPRNSLDQPPSRTVSDLLSPSSEMSQSACGATKFQRVTRSSGCSGLEWHATTLTYGAQLLTSIRILRGRAALITTTTGTAREAPSSQLPTPQLQPASNDVSIRDPDPSHNMTKPPPLLHSCNSDSATSPSVHTPYLPPTSAAAATTNTPSFLLPSPTVATATGTTSIFCGLRVRMGMWTGVPNSADVSVNAAARRTQYSGEVIVLAKLVSDTVHGGMVVLAECSRQRLNADSVRSSRMYVLYCGQHVLSGRRTSRGDGEDALHLYTCYSHALLPRSVVVRPMRTEATLTHGTLEAPVGQGIVVEMRVVGIATLLSWNRQVARESLEILHTAATKMLPSNGDKCRNHHVMVHVVTGASSLEASGIIGDGGGGSGGGGSGPAAGVTSTAAAPPGTMVIIFGDADSAVAWAAAVRQNSKRLSWPEELLENELGEEVWVGDPMNANVDLPIAMEAEAPVPQAAPNTPTAAATTTTNWASSLVALARGTAGNSGGAGGGGGGGGGGGRNVIRRSRFSGGLGSPLYVRPTAPRLADTEGDDNSVANDVGGEGEGISEARSTGGCPAVQAGHEAPAGEYCSLVTAVLQPSGTATPPRKTQVASAVSVSAAAAAASHTPDDGKTCTDVQTSLMTKTLSVTSMPSLSTREARQLAASALKTSPFPTTRVSLDSTGAASSAAAAAVKASSRTTSTSPGMSIPTTAMRTCSGPMEASALTAALGVRAAIAPEHVAAAEAAVAKAPTLEAAIDNAVADLPSVLPAALKPISPGDSEWMLPGDNTVAGPKVKGPHAAVHAVQMSGTMCNVGPEWTSATNPEACTSDKAGPAEHHSIAVDGDAGGRVIGGGVISGFGGGGGDSGGRLGMHLLFRGIRLRFGIAAGPLKGSLVAGDVSGQVSYKGKAFTHAAKLVAKAKAGQICAPSDLARTLPFILAEELTVVDKC